MHGKNKIFNRHYFAELIFCNPFQKTSGLNFSYALNIPAQMRLWNGEVTVVPVLAMMALSSTYS